MWMFGFFDKKIDLYVLSFLCLHWLSIQFLNNDKIWDPVSYNVFLIKKKHMGVMFCLYGPYPIFEHKGMTLYSEIGTKDEWKKYFFVYKGITQFWVLKRWKNNFYSNRRAMGMPFYSKIGFISNGKNNFYSNRRACPYNRIMGTLTHFSNIRAYP